MWSSPGQWQVRRRSKGHGPNHYHFTISSLPAYSQPKQALLVTLRKWANDYRSSCKDQTPWATTATATTKRKSWHYHFWDKFFISWTVLPERSNQGWWELSKISKLTCNEHHLNIRYMLCFWKLSLLAMAMNISISKEPDLQNTAPPVLKQGYLKTKSLFH